MINKKEKRKMIKRKGINWRKIWHALFYLTLIAILVSISFLGGYYYKGKTDQLLIVGLFSQDFCGYEGRWIHVQVQEEANFGRLIEICAHEAGHALFCEMDEENCFRNKEISEHYAEVCEKYPRLCLNDEGMELKHDVVEEPKVQVLVEGELELYSNLSSMPSKVVFYMDSVQFIDRTMNITWSTDSKDGWLFSFVDYDTIIWNFKDKNFTYHKE